MVSTSVFSPRLQDYLWEGKRKVNTIPIILLNVKTREGVSQRQILDENPGEMRIDSCTQEPSWLQCFAERLCLLAAGCQMPGRNIPCKVHPYRLAHSSTPSAQERQDSRQDTADCHASLQGGHGIYSLAPCEHNTIPLSSPVHWTCISYASASAVQAEKLSS